MAYPTNTLALVLDDIDRQIVEVKGLCTSLSSQAASAGLQSSQILNLFTNLKQYRVAIASAASVSGIGAYAQAQKGNAQLDVVAEFNALLTAIDNTTAWISSNFPKDAGGFLLERTLGATGPMDRTFTPAQLAGFKTVLDALAARIA